MNTIIVKKEYYLRIIDIIVRLKTTNRYFFTDHTMFDEFIILLINLWIQASFEQIMIFILTNHKYSILRSSSCPFTLEELAFFAFFIDNSSMLIKNVFYFIIFTNLVENKLKNKIDFTQINFIWKGLDTFETSDELHFLY